MMKVRLIDLDVDLIGTTERAAHVRDRESGKTVWVPLSQCEVVPSDDGKHHVLTIPESLAVEKELI